MHVDLIFADTPSSGSSCRGRILLLFVIAGHQNPRVAPQFVYARVHSLSCLAARFFFASDFFACIGLIFSIARCAQPVFFSHARSLRRLCVFSAFSFESPFVRELFQCPVFTSTCSFNICSMCRRQPRARARTTRAATAAVAATTAAAAEVASRRRRPATKCRKSFRSKSRRWPQRFPR